MDVQVVAYLSTPTAFVFPKRKQKKMTITCGATAWEVKLLHFNFSPNLFPNRFMPIVI